MNTTTPIKIVVTAETAQAAAALRMFVDSAGSGLKSLAPGAASAHVELTKLRETSMLARESFHALELGALSLGAGKLPMLGEAFMGARLTMNGTRTAAMLLGVTLSEVILPLGLIVAGVAAGAYVWHEWNAGQREAEKAAKDLGEAWKALPGLLKEINDAQKAGLLSPTAAKNLTDIATGKTKLYRDSAGNITLNATETIKGGQTVMPMDEGGQSYLAPDEVKNNTPLTPDEQQKVAQDRKGLTAEQIAAQLHLHELAEQATRDELTGIEKIKAANHEKYQKLRDEAQAAYDLVSAREGGVGLDTNGNRANLSTALNKFNQAEANDNLEASRKFYEEQARKQTEAVKQAEEEKKKIVTAEEQALATALEAYANQTTNKTKAYWNNVYQAKYDQAKHELDNELISETEFEKKVADARKEQIAGLREANLKLVEAQKESLQLMRDQFAVERDAVQNDFRLTNEEKRQKEINLLIAEKKAVDDLIASLREKQKLDPANAAPLEGPIVSLSNESRGLGSQLAKKNDGPDVNSFSDNFIAKMTQMQNSMGSMAQNLAGVFSSVFEGIDQGLNQSLTHFILYGGTVKQFMGSIYKSLAESFASSLSKMVTDWIMQHTVMAVWDAIFVNTSLARHVAGETAKTASTGEQSLLRMMWHNLVTIAHNIGVALRTLFHISGESTATTATVAGATTRVAANAAVAGSGAASSQASIPYIGPILAVVAMAAIVAAVMAACGAFEKGGRPPVGELALVGEGGPELWVPDSAGTIIPAGATAALLQGGGAKRVGGGGDSPDSNRIVSHYIHYDKSQMLRDIERDPAHEIYVASVAARTVSKLRG